LKAHDLITSPAFVVIKAANEFHEKTTRPKQFRQTDFTYLKVIGWGWFRAHVLEAERLHGDDTTVPLLAKGGTQTARLWTYVRDDRPFGGDSPPAALFHFSRDRGMANPNRHLAGWQGILQADAYGGYNDLYRADRDPGPVESALCWSHARRKFFELADLKGNARILRTTRHLGRALWKKWAGYHVRSRVEAQMNCLKLFGERIMSRDPDRQTAEIQIRIAIMNRFSALGRAEIEAVA
jgi:hypothetical protein